MISISRSRLPEPSLPARDAGRHRRPNRSPGARRGSGASRRGGPHHVQL